LFKTTTNPSVAFQYYYRSFAQASWQLFSGCAESPYVAYGPGYYPAGYYTGYTYDYNAYPYTYYGPAYDTTIVRSGVRYSDAYGPRYYRTRTVYGGW
jgi:hypothetical protein